jgi:hypothetical protein
LPLAIAVTPARKRFKQLTGSNNHFLITIQVGLDAVASGHAKLNPEFSTTWNPKDLTSSAYRSKEFAHKAMLVWLTAALSAYRTALKRTPGMTLPNEEWEKLDLIDGLAGKLEALADLVGAPCGAERDLVVTAVVWRNQLVHEGSSNPVPATTRTRLLQARDLVADTYQGLDIERTLHTLKRSTNTKAPTFKETTALVRASQRFVQAVDEAVLRVISPTDYLLDALRDYIRHDVGARTSNVWGKGPVRARASIIQIGQSYGMSKLDRGGMAVDSRLERLLMAGPKEAREVLA